MEEVKTQDGLGFRNLLEIFVETLPPRIEEKKKEIERLRKAQYPCAADKLQSSLEWDMYRLEEARRQLSEK